LFGARLAGVNLEIVKLPNDSTEIAELKKTTTPTATFPYLTTSNGVLSEPNAIIQYLAETNKSELLGNNAFEKSQVRQWVELAGNEIARCSKTLICPIFSGVEHTKQDIDAANKEVKEYLTALNRHLEGKNFVVGSGITLADAALFNVIRCYYQLIFVEDQRKKLYPNITAWFVTIAAREEAVKAYGRTVLCKVPVKVPKVVAPKVEAKKEEKPKKADNDDEEEKPKKKEANPLDLLPPSKLVLDEFKKEFLNTPDKAGVLKNFWEKYDPEGYSIYFMQYQKLPTEGKVLFKTNNSASFFLQKFDNFRKYTFSCHGVYGVDDAYEIRGVWMWRGVGIPNEVIY
jgi:elongation factor 1-gamma